MAQTKATMAKDLVLSPAPCAASAAHHSPPSAGHHSPPMGEPVGCAVGGGRLAVAL
uniref:Uncharacterized protein n=1 Tax=Fagus sylvatica TaxID=28930 RepID=A0A2N9EKN8_FAGSY